MRTAMTGVLVAMLAGCAAAPSGPPVIVIDRTVCARCGMLVSESRYAAASQLDGEAARVFDDIGCLLQDLKQSARQADHLWFHDAGSGEWITSAPAFVRASSIRTPMSGGVAAYSSIDAARRIAATHGAPLIASTAELLTGGSR